jgi:hypothetical protein
MKAATAQANEKPQQAEHGSDLYHFGAFRKSMQDLENRAAQSFGEAQIAQRNMDDEFFEYGLERLLTANGTIAAKRHYAPPLLPPSEAWSLFHICLRGVKKC